MLVLTLHTVFPVIIEMGLDPILFGVVVVIVLEMGLISPPVGVNVFVVKSVAQEVPMGTIFRGIWPILAGNGRLPRFPRWIPADRVVFTQYHVWLLEENR